MPNSNLTGIVAAVTTAVMESFEIDVKRLALHCDRLLNDGCSFVSTFGTTGEGASLSSQQKITALNALKAEGMDMARNIPSIMTPSAAEAGALIKESAALGARAVLVLPPFYYNDPTNEGVVAFIDDAMQRAGRPDIDILLYNIPVFTGVTYTADLIDQLIAHFGSAVVGVKDSTGNLDNGIMLAKRFPDLSIFTGNDSVMPPLVEAGGAGMIGGLPNIFSSDLRKIFNAPNAPETAQLREFSGKRIETVDTNGSMLAIKAALAAIYSDPDWARPIPPLMQLDDASIAKVFADFAATGFDLNKA